MRPLLLDPVMVPKPWGGRRLAALGVDLPPEGTWGEAWLVADLDPTDTVQPDPVSRVRAGPYAGARLVDLVADQPNVLLGDVSPHRGRFPLLVKLLDAREHLSVQVHPPAALLADHPRARLKTESWVVVDAAPDAELFLGLVPDADPDTVRATLGTPAIVDLLQRIPARPGDVFHVPAGLVHALGAGVVVAEVQTPSDTTWRLYDWVEEYDRPARELHLEAGWAAIAATWETNTTVVRPEAGAPRLLDTEHYTVDRHDLPADTVLPDDDPGHGRRPRIVQVLSGALDVAGDRVGPGEVVLLPAELDSPPRSVVSSIVLVTAPTT